jgi:hypothetical protein
VNRLAFVLLVLLVASASAQAYPHDFDKIQLNSVTVMFIRGAPLPSDSVCVMPGDTWITIWQFPPPAKPDNESADAILVKAWAYREDQNRKIEWRFVGWIYLPATLVGYLHTHADSPDEVKI